MMQRRLNELGLCARKAVKKPLLAKVMKKRRLNCSQKKRNWSEDDSKETFFPMSKW